MSFGGGGGLIFDQAPTMSLRGPALQALRGRRPGEREARVLVFWCRKGFQFTDGFLTLKMFYCRMVWDGLSMKRVLHCSSYFVGIWNIYIYLLMYILESCYKYS